MKLKYKQVGTIIFHTPDLIIFKFVFNKTKIRTESIVEYTLSKRTAEQFYNIFNYKKKNNDVSACKVRFDHPRKATRQMDNVYQMVCLTIIHKRNGRLLNTVSSLSLSIVVLLVRVFCECSAQEYYLFLRLRILSSLLRV